MDFRQEVVNVLVEVTGKSEEQIDKLLAVPPDSKLGDYAFPCFTLGKNPKEEAEKLQKSIEDAGRPDFLKEVKVAGPYVNFFLNPVVLAKETLNQIYKRASRYGTSKTKSETYMVEFFHANTHKGVHIGHIRNISMGAAICNLLEAIGKNVIRVNYQGDIGPHVAKCVWGYLNLKEEEPGEHKGIWLGKLYAKVSALLKEKPELELEIQKLNTKIYEHDPSIEDVWRKTREWCLDDFNVFYQQFGVQFDSLFFESEAAPVGKEEFEKLLELGVAKISQGAIVVDLNEFNLGVYVGITGKGNPTYQGKEIGLAKLKQYKYKFDKSIHVVGSEQELFFKQVFKTYELMKSPMANKSTHVSYGLVNLPEGKMSSRLGTMILYHNLYEESMNHARKEIRRRHTEISDSEVELRAEMITFGAIKYGMISRENKKTLTFDWERALHCEGDTGPYVQYAHARASSILRKANQSVTAGVSFDLLQEDAEKNLILHLSKFSETIMLAGQEFKPYLLAQYLLKLSQLFNEFYHKHHVMVDDRNLMKARLLLVDCTRQVLENGLNLLGIKAPHEM